MTWAEFRLRLIGFNRSEDRELHKLRRLAWISYIAPHQDPKKLKGLTEEKFWAIGVITKSKVSESTRERFLKITKEYYEQKKALENG